MGLVKNFFIALSNNTFLNTTAKKVGPSLGANKVVAGNQLPDIVRTIKRLNEKNIAGTVDILGEFVHNRQEAIDAKNEILEVMKVLHENNLDAHMSIKLSQLGIEFDRALAYDNVYEIVNTAKSYNNMHINFDTEKYDSLFDVTQTLDRLKSEFTNVGTVIQAYLFKADVLLDKYPDLRLRLVKGAYKESPHIAYQTKDEIDQNYIRLIEKRLLQAKTSLLLQHMTIILLIMLKLLLKNTILINLNLNSKCFTVSEPNWLSKLQKRDIILQFMSHMAMTGLVIL